ncbi:transient receptor potential cation channel subfamily a member 1 [Gigaspora margarita]|uniref:Transient receptor potential cation channel subfamily a member 1 n=3 Tax=Gigaspora margarita TaxID=4874 RepID=A0A8H3X893_GIGMA|nr:transient receptor potential cation channel subfamily a member 1 [Gigaspora margarita]
MTVHDMKIEIMTETDNKLREQVIIHENETVYEAKIDVMTELHQHKITTLICSPNLKYIATMSKMDEVIIIWHNETQLKPISKFFAREITNAQEYHHGHELVELSDDALVVIEREGTLNMFDTKKRQHIKIWKIAEYKKIRCTFLYKGDFMLVLIHPNDKKVLFKFKIYLYSVVNNRLQCKTIYTFDQHNYYNLNCTIFRNGKLLISGNKNIAGNFCLLWNAETEASEFEISKVVDLPNVLFGNSEMQYSNLNNDSIIAILHHGLKIYSAKTGIRIADLGVVNNEEIMEDNKGFNINFVNQGKHLLISYFPAITRFSELSQIVIRLINPYSPESDESLDIFIGTNFSSENIRFFPQRIYNDRVIGIVYNKVQIHKIFQDDFFQNLRNRNLNEIHFLCKTHFLCMTDEILKKIEKGLSVLDREFRDKKEFKSIKILKGHQIYWRYDGKKLSAFINNTEEIVAESIIFEGPSYRVKRLSNDDLIMMNSKFSIIVTPNVEDKKLRMLCFLDNKNLKNETSKFLFSEKYFIDIFSNYRNNYKFFDEYSLKYLIENHIKDTPFFLLYAEALLKAAIRKQRGEVVDMVFEECMRLIKDNPDNINILKIITSLLPELYANYPKYVNRFLLQTSLLLSPNQLYESLQVTKNQHLFPCTPEFHMFKHTLISMTYFYLYSKYAIRLVIPLPKFSTYDPEYSFWKEILGKPSSNGFIKMQITEIYSNWSGEVLLNFKWKTFGRLYYCFIWFIHTFLLVIFSLGVTETKGIISTTGRNICLWLSIIIGCLVLFSIEVRQFIWDWKFYITSTWNFFDLCSLLFPIVTSIYWLTNGPPPLWAPALSCVFLYLKFLFFLRAFEYYNAGRYLAIMAGVVRKVFTYLLILGIIILGFAHAFYILLQPSSERNDTTDNNTDLYSRFETSLLAVYLLMIDSLINFIKFICYPFYR